MLWVALVVALGLLVGALIVTVGYRHSVMIGAVIVAALIAALIWYLRFENVEGTGLIEPSELELRDLSLSNQYRSSYRMTARLFNRSSGYALQSVTIMITAADCHDGEVDCIVVGEAQRTIPVEIPPGQARDIVEQYSFPRFVIQGQLEWRHSISRIEARRP